MSDTSPSSFQPRDGAVSRIGAASFKSHCLQIMDQVKETGEEVIITKHGQPVAKLVPMSPQQERKPILGACKGTLTIADEHDLIPSTEDEWAKWAAKLEQEPDKSNLA